MVSLLVEDFLLKNVVNLHKLVPEMEARLAKYEHVTVDFQEEWVNMLRMQFIVHEICKRGGLINGYLNTRTPDIKSLALKAGVDENVARDLLKQIMNKFGSLPS